MRTRSSMRPTHLLTLWHVVLQVVTTARDPERKPCLIFGEPGLQKDNIAALLHFGGPDRNKPMVQVCSTCTTVP